MEAPHIVVIVKKEILPIGKCRGEHRGTEGKTHFYRYCDSCADWLCLQCKNAHARVRLTKDHTVTQKANGEVRKIRSTSQTDKLLCQVNLSHIIFCTLFHYSRPFRSTKKN